MSLRNKGWVATISILMLAIGAALTPTIVNSFSSDGGLVMVQSFLAQCQARARQNGAGGTTAAFDVNANGLDRIYCYDGRPAPNESVQKPAYYGPRLLPVNTNVKLKGVAATPPFAIFYGTDGSIGTAQWSIGDGTIANDPSCAPGTMTYVVSTGQYDDSIDTDCLTGMPMPTPTP